MKILHSTISAPSLPYAFYQPLEQLAFFDIETTGLSPRASSIYLIGVMYRDASKSTWEIIQWFADDYRSEAAILTAFLEFLRPYHALYHFNGAAFDIPYVLAKCEKYHLPLPEYARDLFHKLSSHQTKPGKERISVDILKEIRPLKKKLRLTKANQTALERWLGLRREDQYNGGQLISVYTEYMQSKILHPDSAERLEKLLLLHNHDDMAGMLEICSIFSYQDALSPPLPPHVTGCNPEKDRAVIQFRLEQCVPKTVRLEHAFANPREEAPLPPALLRLEQKTGTLTLPVCRGTLKFFFEPFRDYFYLPQEDTAVHKSVAQFVDPGFRRKATAATCYTKTEGSFLPSVSKKPAIPDTPLFYPDYRKKPAWYRLPDPCQTDRLFRQLSDYLFYELPAF